MFNKVHDYLSGVKDATGRASEIETRRGRNDVRRALRAATDARLGVDAKATAAERVTAALRFLDQLDGTVEQTAATL